MSPILTLSRFQTYKDQFFAPPPAPIPSFFPLFAVLELVFHLPVSAWAVRRLWPSGAAGLDGRAELLLLVYGVETVLTTATCMWEAWLVRQMIYWFIPLSYFGMTNPDRCSGTRSSSASVKRPCCLEDCTVLISRWVSYIFSYIKCYVGTKWKLTQNIAAVLSIDMYYRLWKRLDGVDGRKKMQ